MLDPQEIQRRRDMVQQGLRELLPPDALVEAVRICETEFRREAVFSVNRFVDRLTEIRPDLQSNKGPMFRALIARNARRVEASNNDKGITQSIASAKPTNATNSNTSTGGGWPVVFNHLLKELSSTFMLLDGEAFRSLGAYLERHAKLPELARSEMRHWLISMQPEFTRVVSQAEMHQILHHTYIWACMEMGPIDADKHFSRAIRSASTLPEAIHYRPQQLM